MANYGSLDTSAYRNLIDANRMKTEAITSTIGNLGNLAAGVIEKRAKNKKLAGIDVTDLAKDAGVKWEGMESGTKLSMLDASHMGLDTLQIMTSMVRTKLQNDQLRNDLILTGFWGTLNSDTDQDFKPSIVLSKSRYDDLNSDGFDVVAKPLEFQETRK